MSQIDLILLVGGTSRIPLVGQMVGGELGRPVAIDAHPKHSVCQGAALAAAAGVGDSTAGSGGGEDVGVPAAPEVTTAIPEPPEAARVSPAADTSQTEVAEPSAAGADVPEPPAADAVGSEPPAAVTEAGAYEPPRTSPQPLKVTSSGGSGSRSKLLIGVGVAVIAVIGAVVALTSGGDRSPAPPDTASVTTEAEVVPSTAAPDEVAASTTTIAATTTTAAATTTEALFTCAGLCAHIEGFTTKSGELVIERSSHNFTPDVFNFHVHFSYNVYAPEQAGTKASFYGTTPGSWQLADQQPFSTGGTAVSVAGASHDVTAICVVVTDSGHGVVNPENFECLDIPAELRG